MYQFLLAGTPEAGGWTTREFKRILRGLAGLNFVYVPANRCWVLIGLTLYSGADIVEVAPAYDNGGHFAPVHLWQLMRISETAEITGIAAADFVHDFLSMFMSKEPPKIPVHWPKKD